MSYDLTKEIITKNSITESIYTDDLTNHVNNSILSESEDIDASHNHNTLLKQIEFLSNKFKVYDQLITENNSRKSYINKQSAELKD